jgi:serine/threonine-protein phosphatase PP1 catalytic subunit
MGTHAQSLYDRLLAGGSQKRGVELLTKVNDFYTDGFFDRSVALLHSDPILLRLDAPVVVVGDIHGQFYDLSRFIRLGGPISEHRYLFLGDYVDRGSHSLEVITFLLAAKLLYPTHVYLLRGNHETEDISEYYGFKEECERRFGDDTGYEIWRQFNRVFKELPLCAIVGERIFCVHGGISPDVDIIANAVTDDRFVRPLEIPEDGLITDFVWADPSAEDPGFMESDRGASWTFGTDATAEFLRRNDFDLIVRAHQVVKQGYEFPFDSNHTVVTVFSCPNYCGDCENDGGMLIIGEDLSCQIKIVYWNEGGEAFDKRCAAEIAQQALRSITRSPTPIAVPVLDESSSGDEEEEEESWTSPPESEDDDE